MARLPRCFLHLILITLTLSTFALNAHAGSFSKLLSKEWLPPSADCLNKSLDFIKTKKMVPAERIKLEGAAYYNDQIFKKFSEIPKAEWDRSLEATINNFAQYDAKFDAPSFKKWLSENPLEIKPSETMGSYLKRNNERFLKKYPEGKIEDVVSEIPGELKKIAKECGKDPACNEKKIGAMLADKLKNTCLGKHMSVAVKSMITSLALTNIGYGISTAKHPEGGYPYDLMLTNLLWTPIMASIGCRNTLEQGSIGNKVDFGQRVTFSTENAKIKFNNYVSYMILSPLSNATYVGFHTTRQLISGEKEWKDVHMWDLAKQVGSITLYDAMYVTPRMIFITDPLYLKGIPAMGGFLNRNMSSIPATGLTYLTDWGSRVGLSFVNTEALNWWLGKSDGWWDTKFNGEDKKTIPTPPTTDPKNKVANEVITTSPNNPDKSGYSDSITPVIK